MLSRSSIYAIQAMAHLSKGDPEIWQMRRGLAQTLELPSQFLGKILGTLATVGLLESSRGRHGGYRLAHAASDITLEAVVKPFDRTLENWPCMLQRGSCADNEPCQIHERWLPVHEALVTFLTTTTVADLTEDLPGPVEVS